MKKLHIVGGLILVLGSILTVYIFSNDVRDAKDANIVTNITPVVENQMINKEPSLSTSQFSVIDLSNQNLSQAPANIFTKIQVEKLDLSHNKLTGALQAEIRNLTLLRILDLSDNQFAGVPAEVGQLSNLEELDLSNNQLTGLPYELGNLQNLRLLDLRGNNYAVTDLEIIKKGLSPTVKILTD